MLCAPPPAAPPPDPLCLRPAAVAAGLCPWPADGPPPTTECADRGPADSEDQPAPETDDPAEPGEGSGDDGAQEVSGDLEGVDLDESFGTRAGFRFHRRLEYDPGPDWIDSIEEDGASDEEDGASEAMGSEPRSPGGAPRLPGWGLPADGLCGGSLACVLAATVGSGRPPGLPAGLLSAYDDARAAARAGRFGEATAGFVAVAGRLPPALLWPVGGGGGVDVRLVCSQATLVYFADGGPPEVEDRLGPCAPAAARFAPRTTDHEITAGAPDPGPSDPPTHGR